MNPRPNQAPQAPEATSESFSVKLHDLFEALIDEYPLVQPGLQRIYNKVVARANQELGRDKPNVYEVIRDLQSYLGGMRLMVDHRMEKGDAHPDLGEIRRKLISGVASISLANSRGQLEWDGPIRKKWDLKEIERPQSLPVSAKLKAFGLNARDKVIGLLSEKVEVPIADQLESARQKFIKTYGISNLHLPAIVGSEETVERLTHQLLKEGIPKAKKILNGLISEERAVLKDYTIQLTLGVDDDTPRAMNRWIQLNLEKSEFDLRQIVKNSIRRPRDHAVTDNLQAERTHLPNQQDPRERHLNSKAKSVARKFGLRGISLNYNAAGKNQEMEIGLNRLEAVLKEFKQNNEVAVLNYLANYSIALYVGSEPEKFDNVITVKAESAQQKMLDDFRKMQKEGLTDAYSAEDLKAEWNFRHLMRTDLEPGQDAVSAEYAQKIRDVLKAVDPKYHRMIKEANLSMQVVMHSETMLDIRQAKACQLDITKDAEWLVAFFNRKCEEAVQKEQIAHATTEDVPRSHLTNQEDASERNLKSKAQHLAIQFSIGGIALHYNDRSGSNPLAMGTGLNKLERVLKLMKQNNQFEQLEALESKTIALYMGAAPDEYENSIRIDAGLSEVEMREALEKETEMLVFTARSNELIEKYQLQGISCPISLEYINRLEGVIATSLSAEQYGYLEGVSFTLSSSEGAQNEADLLVAKTCTLNMNHSAMELGKFLSDQCNAAIMDRGRTAAAAGQKKEDTAKVTREEINKEHFAGKGGVLETLAAEYGLASIHLDEDVFDYNYDGVIEEAVKSLRSSLEQLKEENGGRLSALSRYPIIISNRKTARYQAEGGGMVVCINKNEVPTEIVVALKRLLANHREEALKVHRALKQECYDKLKEIFEQYQLKTVEIASSALKDPRWVLQTGLPLFQNLLQSLDGYGLHVMRHIKIRIEREKQTYVDDNNNLIGIQVEGSATYEMVQPVLDHFGLKLGINEQLRNFIGAAKAGNNEQLAEMMRAGMHPNTPDANRDLAAVMAAEEGRWETVFFLIECGADPNKGDLSGKTPLMAAVEQAQIGAVRELLKRGADPRLAGGPATKVEGEEKPRVLTSIDRAKQIKDAQPSYLLCKYMMTDAEMEAYKQELMELGRQRAGDSQISVLNKLEFFFSSKEEAASYVAELKNRPTDDDVHYSRGLSGFFKDINVQNGHNESGEVATSQIRGLGPARKTESNEGPALPDPTGSYTYNPSLADQMPGPNSEPFNTAPTLPIPTSVALVDQAQGKQTDFGAQPPTRQERPAPAVQPPTPDFPEPAPTVHDQIVEVSPDQIKPLGAEEVTEMANVAEALEQISKEGTQFTTRADKAFESGEFDVAISMWLELVKNGRTNLETAKKLGMAYDKLGDPKSAYEWYMHAYRTKPEDEDLLWKLANHFYKNDNLPQACLHLQQLIEANPKHAKAHSILGALLGELKNHQNAIIVLQKAIELNPKQVATHHNLAAILFRLARASTDAQERGQYAGLALKSAQAALQLQSNYGPSLGLLDQIIAFEA